MNKKILIMLLVGVLLVSGCGDANTNSTSDNLDTTTGETVDNTTYKLRSYTTSMTYYLTAPAGYEYDDDRTGTMHNKAVFTKDDITLTYAFESQEVEEFFEDAQRYYERKLESDYYQDAVWQDEKSITVNDIDVSYVKITYNTGSTYYSDIYSIAYVNGWKVSCEIEQSGVSSDFEDDSSILKTAWGITFSED